MDEDLGKEINDDSQSENHPNQDEIPSWLQGLEDQENEEDEVRRTSKKPDDQWVREVDNNDMMDINKEFQANFEEPEDMDQDLPEWLHEMTQAEAGPEETIIEKPGDSELQGDELLPSKHEEINADLMSENDREQLGLQTDITPEPTQDFIKEPQSDTQSERGFIEISEFDIQEADRSEVAQENKIDQEGEILSPEYSETVSPLPELNPSTEKTDQQDSPTQPVPVMREKSELPGMMPPFAANLPMDSAPDTWRQVMEDETESGPEDFQAELLQVKKYLEEKEFSEAARILGQYIEQACYLPEIKSILEEAMLDDELIHSYIWELSGDVALKSSHPEEAIHAYARAIHALLSTDRSKQ